MENIVPANILCWETDYFIRLTQIYHYERLNWKLKWKLKVFTLLFMVVSIIKLSLSKIPPMEFCKCEDSSGIHKSSDPTYINELTLEEYETNCWDYSIMVGLMQT